MLTIWQKDKFKDMGYDMSTLKHRELLNGIIEKYFPFESILDVGCATGIDLFITSMVMPTTKRVGFDMAPENVKEAHDRGIKADITEADAYTKLKEIPDKSFDVVFSNGVVMYLERPLIKEMLRIAKKAVILSERDVDQNMLNYIENELKLPVVVTKVTEDIRDSWKENGYIYEIVV